MESSNILGKRYTSIGKDLIRFVPHVCTTKSVNNCCYSNSMKDCRLMDQNMIDAATGTSSVVSEVSIFDNLRLENQLTELTSLVRQVVVVQH
ncbi:hypothetical protein CR513_11293, partial [Mucuna pruriens]